MWKGVLRMLVLVDPMNVHSPPWLSTSPYSGFWRFLLRLWQRRALTEIKSRCRKCLRGYPCTLHDCNHKYQLSARWAASSSPDTPTPLGREASIVLSND